MGEKENKAFKRMLMLMTVSEVLSIVLCVLYVLIGSIVMVLATNEYYFIPIFIIVGAILIIILVISIQFKKATIICYKSITDDVHRMAEAKGLVQND